MLDVVFDVRVSGRTYSEASDMIANGEWNETNSIFTLDDQGRSHYQYSDDDRPSSFNIEDLELTLIIGYNYSNPPKLLK